MVVIAVTVGKLNAAGRSFVMGDRVGITVDVTGDTSYPTGGWPISPATFGLDEIHHFDATLEASGTNTASFDYVNNKLKTFSAFGTETANTTNLSTRTWRVFIIGKGRPGGVS